MNNQIDIGKAISYIFDDPDWVTKIGILFLVNLAFGALAFILVGFIFLAAQYGWMIGLIRNMKVGDTTPMPEWSDFADKMQLGAGPLGAFILYMLIPIIFSCVLFVPAILAGSVSEDIAGVFGLGAACLWVPLFVVYAAAAWYFFTIGTIRYASTENFGEYLKFAGMIEFGRAHQDVTLRYILFVVLVQVGMSIVSSTAIGGIIPAIFATPVLGHLMGQYALATEGNGKKKKVGPGPA